MPKIFKFFWPNFILPNLLRKIRRIFSPPRPFRLRLPAELVDESFKFLPYQKCAKLAKTSRSHFLAELAEYRLGEFPKFMAEMRPINCWLLKAIRRMLIYYRVGVPLEEYEALKAENDEFYARIEQRRLARKNAGIPIPKCLAKGRNGHGQGIGNQFSADLHSAEFAGQRQSSSIYGSASHILFRHRHTIQIV